jgi:hypothetical protein
MSKNATANMLKLQGLDSDVLPYPSDAPIRTIKNMGNNQILSVMKQPVDSSTYSIRANDQCMYVYDSNDYALKPCAISDEYINPQFFNEKRIMNEVTEARLLGKKSTSQTQVYPYTIFQHKSTQQCLTFDNEGMYISTCEPNNIYQRWAVSPDETICLNQ